MRTDPVQILIDNGFFRSVCRKGSEEAMRRWGARLAEMGVDGYRGDRYLITPFLFLEMIGVQPPRLPPLKNDGAHASFPDMEDYKEHILNRALSHFSQAPELQVTELERKRVEQEPHFSKIGRDVFREAFGNAVANRGYQESIHLALALDYLFKQDYPIEIRSRMIASFAMDVLRAPAHGWNLSAFRAAQLAWLTLHPEIRERGTFSEETLGEIEKSLPRRRDDFVDTELAHFVVTGCLSKTEDQLEPVYAFTCDNPKKIAYRIGLFKSFLNPALEHVASLSDRERLKLPFKILPHAGGRVFFCQPDGTIAEELDSKAIGSIDDWSRITKVVHE